LQEWPNAAGRPRLDPVDDALVRLELKAREQTSSRGRQGKTSYPSILSGYFANEFIRVQSLQDTTDVPEIEIERYGQLRQFQIGRMADLVQATDLAQTEA